MATLRSAHSGSRRAILAVVGGMAGITICFGAATLFNHVRLDLAARAVSVATNGAPSVELLGDVRHELRRLRRAADALIVADDQNAAGEIERAIRRLHEALSAELRTPEYPHEREQAMEVVSTLGRLDQAVGLLQSDTAGAEGPARYADVVRLVDELDDRVDQLHRINARSMSEDADALLRHERSLTRRVFWSELGCVLLAALVTLLVANRLHAQFRVIERRANELEHFAVQVGHDVLNPLLPIQITLDLCRDMASDAMLQRAIDRGTHAVERLRGAATALLGFARAGLPPGPEEQTSLAAALESAEAATSTRVSIEPFADRTVAAGAPAIDALVSSFLHECERESEPSDPIRLRVRPSDGSVRVEFYIPRRPHGQRGTELFAPRIRGVASGYPGIDLELAAARRIVSAHRGRLGVTNDGAAHVLWFELPVA